jgi:hypothetical protein
MTYGIWPGFSGQPESCWNMHGSLFWHQYVYMATGFRCTSKLWLTNDSKPFAASFSKFNSDHLSQDWPTQELAIQLINRLHLLLVINNNNQEHQWYQKVKIKNATEIPLEQFLIKEPTTPTSGLWFASKMAERWFIYAVQCAIQMTFWQVVSFEQITWVECQKRHTLMKRSQKSRIIAHLSQKCHHSLSATLYDSHETPESGKSSTSWCSVDSSSCPGLSFGSHQQNIFPSRHNSSVRVDTLCHSRQRHPSGSFLCDWPQYLLLGCISPSDRCFTGSSRCPGLQL